MIVDRVCPRFHFLKSFAVFDRLTCLTVRLIDLRVDLIRFFVVFSVVFFSRFADRLTRLTDFVTAFFAAFRFRVADLTAFARSFSYVVFFRLGISRFPLAFQPRQLRDFCVAFSANVFSADCLPGNFFQL
jgi:hypothetical protein